MLWRFMIAYFQRVPPQAWSVDSPLRAQRAAPRRRLEAKLQLLRGQPGELTFRRGAMAAEFEQAAFAATPGSLLPPVHTQFG